MLYGIIRLGCYQNGKRFAFCQNEYILRASSIIGGDTYGKYKWEEQKMSLEVIVGVVGIVVTVISIIVTVISIVQTTKKKRASK